MTFTKFGLSHAMSAVAEMAVSREREAIDCLGARNPSRAEGLFYNADQLFAKALQHIPADPDWIYRGARAVGRVK
jgi:hypothetical protein